MFRRKAGFSLVEVTITLGVMSVGVLALTQMMSNTMKSIAVQSSGMDFLALQTLVTSLLKTPQSPCILFNASKTPLTVLWNPSLIPASGIVGLYAHDTAKNTTTTMLISGQNYPAPPSPAHLQIASITLKPTPGASSVGLYDLTIIVNRTVPNTPPLSQTFHLYINQDAKTGSWTCGLSSDNQDLKTLCGGLGLTWDTSKSPGQCLPNAAFGDITTSTANGKGKVGIGTTTPGVPLDIVGYLHASGTAAPTLPSQGAYLSWNVTAGAGETDFINQKGGGSGGFRFYNAATTGNSITKTSAPQMTIDGSGKVGIGTASPSNALQISTSKSNDGLIVSGNQTAGNTTAVFLSTNLGSAAYNNITQPGDSGLIYEGTALGTAKGFVIAPWAGPASGIRMDGSGKVGIGTPSPQQNLSVNGGMNVDQASGNNGGGLNPGISFGSGSGEGIASARSGTNQFGLDFYTGSNRRMSIHQNGNVGIATANPQTTLDVNGAIRPQAAWATQPCSIMGAQAYQADTGEPLYCSNSLVWTKLVAEPQGMLCGDYFYGLSRPPCWDGTWLTPNDHPCKGMSLRNGTCPPGFELIDWAYVDVITSCPIPVHRLQCIKL